MLYIQHKQCRYLQSTTWQTVTAWSGQLYSALCRPDCKPIVSRAGSLLASPQPVCYGLPALSLGPHLMAF